MKLEVALPKDRFKVGTATATLDGGEQKIFRCLGRSDTTAARKAGNPTRDPLKKMGDLPTGSYTAIRIPPKPQTPSNLRSYGPGPCFALTPKSGDALKAAKNGRSGILIHGGAIGAPMPAGALRPTRGCLRIDDSAVFWLGGKAPLKFPVTVRVI